MEATTRINVNDLNELIQTDDSRYRDECAYIFGRDGERTYHEIKADQIVDLAAYRVREWINNQDNIINHAKFEGIAPRDENAVKAFWSKRYRKQWYESRLEDLIKSAQFAAEHQADMYEDLDERLAEEAKAREPESFVDERTSLQCFIQHYLQELESWTDDELHMLLSVGFGPEEAQGLLSWKAEIILTERACGRFYNTKYRINKLFLQFTTQQELNTAKQSFNIAYFFNTTEDSKADEFFSLTPEAHEYFRLNILRGTLRRLIMDYHSSLVDRRIRKQLAFEAKLRDISDDPLRAVAIKPIEETDKFWLDDGQDGYLEGSCTDIKYICNDGSID